MKKILSTIIIVALLNLFFPRTVFALSTPVINTSSWTPTADPIARVSSPVNLTHTVNSGLSASALVVMYHSTAGDDNGTWTCTWNGGAMTAGAGNTGLIGYFYKAAPAAGTYTVSCSFTAGDSRALIAAHTITGVDQTTVVDTDIFTTGSGSGKLTAHKAPGTATDLLIDFGNCNGTITTVTALTPQTKVYGVIGTTNGVSGAGSYKAATTTADTTMTLTYSGASESCTWQYGWVAIRAGATSASFNFYQFFAF